MKLRLRSYLIVDSDWTVYISFNTRKYFDFTFNFIVYGMCSFLWMFGCNALVFGYGCTTLVPSPTDWVLCVLAIPMFVTKILIIAKKCVKGKIQQLEIWDKRINKIFTWHITHITLRTIEISYMGMGLYVFGIVYMRIILTNELMSQV